MRERHVDIDSQGWGTRPDIWKNKPDCNRIRPRYTQSHPEQPLFHNSTGWCSSYHSVRNPPGISFWWESFPPGE